MLTALSHRQIKLNVSELKVSFFPQAFSFKPWQALSIGAWYTIGNRNMTR
jgi:hypothetical protein